MRLVTLTGTSYEKEFIKFAKQMNSYLSSFAFKIEIVRSTAPIIGQLLFNNNNKSSVVQECSMNNCVVCPIGTQNKSGLIKSSVTDKNIRSTKILRVTTVVYTLFHVFVQVNTQVKQSILEIETCIISTVIPQQFQTIRFIKPLSTSSVIAANS